MRNANQPTPEKCLPDWARAYFDRNRARFDELEMVPVAPDGTKRWLKYTFPDVGLDPGETLVPTNRHEAFYRLFCTENDGMRRMWRRADEVIVIDMNQRPIPEDGRWFLGSIIYGTDDALPEEKLSYTPPPPQPPPQRPNQEQRAARKVARLLQCLSRVTPRDCYARKRNRWFGATVEWLVVCYGFYLGPFDYSRLDRVYDLTYTSDSKRGWIQRRRAHDRIRHQAIAAIRRLVGMTRNTSHPLIAELRQIADDLTTWPDMEAEHRHQIDLLSNKAGWADWLRHAYDRWLDALDWGEARGHLRQCDWAVLAAALFPEHFGAAGAPDERLIRAILAKVEATRPERQQAERGKIWAEEADLQASRALRD